MSDNSIKNKNALSYYNEFIKAYNEQRYSGENYLLSPQLLNSVLKDINMNGERFSIEDIKTMVMAPQRFEQELRRLSYFLYNHVSIYKRGIEYKANVLDFDWEIVPYSKTGRSISATEFSSNKFKSDWAKVSKFFNNFNIKEEFAKVLFNVLLYDTYFVAVRNYDDHIYLQEMPSTHCMIDATSFLGYLYSFDLSYFMRTGVDINAYSSVFKEQYAKAIDTKAVSYQPNLPDRNGQWVYWYPVSPDDGWVFKYNNAFVGSVPPMLDVLIDYSTLDFFKDLEIQKAQLEAYKVIVASVPRLTNNRTGNKTDDFAISSAELGKFIAMFKSSLKNGVDFKAAPLDDFQMFDFSSSSDQKDILDTEISNILKESGVSDAVLTGGSSVSSNNIYKLVTSEIIKSMYPQFSKFCEYQINKMTKNYRFKVKFTGTIFDREDRRKSANEDMERGIITPAIFSSRGIQMTDATNIINMMYSLGYPELFKPIKTASTMSSEEKTVVGRKQLDDDCLSDAGEYTRNIDANNDREGDVL